MKTHILAIGAHPDDVELAAGGTLLRHIALGHSVAIADLTRGELGTRGSAELRDAEAAESARIMGVKYRENLGLKDGFFEQDEASLLRLITVIRKYQPEIVLANSISDRHPDHGRGASFAARACFLAGLVKIETLWEGIPQAPHRPKAVYHYIQDRALKPDLVVDISPWFEKKMEAIMAFGSQFYSEGDEGPQTPISSKSFLEFLESRARDFGRYIHAEYGEGFTVERPAGVDDLLDLR
ncbi:MAG: bacillithiol biosynthesis deacetylase BshB1 [Bacteroidetes bacterium]|nr:bacillithiol biosynthesis deacetylase BshB1 [Bacteroidota bacterium]